MKNINVFMILLFLLLVSCHKQNKQVSGVNHIIDLDIKQDNVECYTDILNIERIIQLKGDVIGHIDRIIYHNKRYIILDKRLKQVKVFSEEGNFLNNVGKIGKGPGEFVAPLDMSISNSGQLYVLDDTKQINVYNLDGTWINNIKLPTYFLKLQVLKNGTLALLHPSKKFKTNGKQYKLYILSKKGKVITPLLRIPENQTDYTFSLRNSFQQFDNEIHMVVPFNDTIYSINDNQLEKYAIIKYAKMITPLILDNQPKSFNGLPSYRDVTQKYAMNYFYYLESEKFIAFAYVYKRRTTAVFYNKEKKQFKKYNYANLHDPLAFLDPKLIYDGDSLLSLFYPYVIKSKDLNLNFRLKWLSNKNPKLGETLSKLISNMKIEDNPYIIISKLEPTPKSRAGKYI